MNKMKTSSVNQAIKIVQNVLDKYEISDWDKDPYTRGQKLWIEVATSENMRVLINTERISFDPFETFAILDEIADSLEEVFEVKTQFFYNFYFIDLSPKVV
jgi:hypothetical protein